MGDRLQVPENCWELRCQSKVIFQTTSDDMFCLESRPQKSIWGNFQDSFGRRLGGESDREILMGPACVILSLGVWSSISGLGRGEACP